MIEKNILLQEEIDALLNPVMSEDEWEHSLDDSLELTVAIGQVKTTIRDLLQLNQGDSVDFEQFANESLDLLVNGILIARGELIARDNNLRIRLTDIANASERINALARKYEIFKGE
jgi:flagellar motor switch protein FliN